MMMTRDSMIIFGVVGALFLILLVMFLMTAEMFREGYRGNRRRKAKAGGMARRRPAQKKRLRN